MPELSGLLDGTRLEASVCSVKAMDIISCSAQLDLFASGNLSSDQI